MVSSSRAAPAGNEAATLTCYAHVSGASKRSVELFLDDYDERDDRIFLREEAPLLCHGCPLFHAGAWVGIVTAETEDLPEERRAEMDHAPLYVRAAERTLPSRRLPLPRR